MRDNVAFVALTDGSHATIDVEDIDLVKGFRWRASHGYAIRSDWGGGRNTFYLMHRTIMGCAEGDGRIIDHVDFDGLNNRRSNLRDANNSLNMAHARHPLGKSQFRGVHLAKSRYRAQIKGDGRLNHLGYFATAEAAAKAYDLAATQRFGPFAILNFPEEAA